MKITKIIGIVAAAGLIGLVVPGMAAARTNVSIGIGIGYPAYPAYPRYGYWCPPPCYYHPRVVYVAPPPVVYAPAPVIVAPAPVVVSQPVIAVPASSYVNVTNSNGSITPVLINRSGNMWVGPKGEMYTAYPSAEQLRPIYGF